MRQRAFSKRNTVVLVVLLGVAGPSARAEFLRGPFLQNVTVDSITVVWETREPATANITVDGKPASVVIPRQTRQEARLSRFGPDEPHAYAVTLDDGTKAEGVFRTAPPPGRPLRFVAWGDSRSNPDICRRIANDIAATGVGMAIHTGDLVGAGRDLSQWNPMYFDPCRDMLRRVANYPVIGNHELAGPETGPDGRAVLRDLFVLPGNEIWYSFDYGDAHICVLDSTEKPTADSDQYRWAEQDLLGSKAKWKIVACHHPFYSSGARGGSAPHRILYGPLLARAGVQLIVSGHDHLYEFTRPIAHKYEPAAKQPYYQLIAGGGGAPLHPVGANKPWSDRGQSVHHFVLIDIDGDRLNGRAIGLDGQEIDRFTIDRSKPAVDVVWFERIRLVEALEEPSVLDAGGARFRRLLEPADAACEARIRLRNPVPETVVAVVSLVENDGYHWEPREVRLTMPARQGAKDGEATASFRLTVADPARLYPAPRVSVRAATSFGRDVVVARTPLAIGLRKTLGLTTADFAADSSSGDPWRSVPLRDDLLRETADAIEPAARGLGLAFQAALDGRTLRLLVRCPAVKRAAGDRPGPIDKEDHVTVLLASPERSIRLRISSDGRSEVSGIESGDVKCVARSGKDGWTAEMEVPTMPLGGERPDGFRPWRFNVVVQYDRERHVFSPTFGETPAYENGANLVCE